MGEKQHVPGLPGSLVFGPFGTVPVRLLEDGGEVWTVAAVLDHWRSQGWKLFGPTTPTEWWVLHVKARVPDPAGEWPEGVVQVTTYNDRPGWWIEHTEETSDR